MAINEGLQGTIQSQRLQGDRFLSYLKNFSNENTEQPIDGSEAAAPDAAAEAVSDVLGGSNIGASSEPVMGQEIQQSAPPVASKPATQESLKHITPQTASVRSAPFAAAGPAPIAPTDPRKETAEDIVSQYMPREDPLPNRSSTAIEDPADEEQLTISSDGLLVSANSADDQTGDNSDYTEPSDDAANAMSATIKMANGMEVLKDRKRWSQNVWDGAASLLNRITPKPESVVQATRMARRFSKATKEIRDENKKTLADKDFRGISFYETIFSDPTLYPHEVSIGTDNLMESLREPNSKLLNIVNRKLEKMWKDGLFPSASEAPFLTLEECLNDIDLLADTINSIRLEVVLDKSPVNINGSIQVRTVQVRNGRGIGLHPTQTKAYNADFDGDPSTLNFDQSQLPYYGRAMERMIDPEGNASIDPDFFPCDEIRNIEDTYQAFLDRYLTFITNKNDAKIIFEAYMRLCNYADYINQRFNKEITKVDINNAWVEFLRSIDKVAARYSGKINSEVYEHGLYENVLQRNEITSLILKDVYDFAIQRRGLAIKLKYESEGYETTFTDNQAKRAERAPDPFVDVLVDITEGIIATGTPPMNFMDFTILLNKYYGTTGKNTNVPFRLVADYAKAINRTDDMLYGLMDETGGSLDGYVPAQTLWEKMMQVAETMRIKGVIHIGSREMAASTLARDSIFRDMKKIYGSVIPDWRKIYVDNFTQMMGQLDKNLAGKDLENAKADIKNRAYRAVHDEFRIWIGHFVQNYNHYTRMINSADISVYGGFRLKRTGTVSKFDGITDMGDLAYALIKVYGDYTVDRLLPGVVNKSHFAKMRNYEDNADGSTAADEGIAGHYANMSIESFSRLNRINFYNEKHNGKDVGKTTAIAQRWGNKTFTPMDVMYSIADRRSADFGRYHSNWVEATESHFGTFDKIIKYYNDKKYQEYAASMIETIYLMSPDMFTYYGMDSPFTFVESEWGQKILSCANADQYRSVLMEMLIEYRFAKAQKILSNISDTKIMSNYMQDDLCDNLDDLDAQYQSELKSLASSSMVWNTIISEMNSGSRYFKLIKSDVDTYKLKHNYKEDQTLEAEPFWRNETKYDTLIDFLFSDETFETKIGVLTDISKSVNNYKNISKTEIMGQLLCHPDRLHAGSRFDSNIGIRSDIDAVKESVDKMTSYQKSTPEEINKRASHLFERLKAPGALQERLDRFTTNPGAWIRVDPMLFADAVASVYSPTFADSEKGKQQARVNAFFESISYQRCGGFYTHLQQTDNAVINYIAWDQLNPMHVMNALADPDIKFTIYDDFGRTTELSRMTICGGVEESDIVRWLKDNPRFVLLLEHLTVNASDDVDGTVRLSSIEENEEYDYTDESWYHMFSLFNDRPRFAAMTALLTASGNNVSRNMSGLINNTVKNLCNIIALEAGKIKPNNTGEIRRTVDNLMDNFGLTRDNINKLKRSRLLDKQNPGSYYFFEDDEEFNKQTLDLLSVVRVELEECLDIASKYIQDNPIEMIPSYSLEYESDKFSIDEASIVSFYSVLQQIGGARTNKMINVEGAETKKNLALKYWLKPQRDKYMLVDKRRFSQRKLKELDALVPDIDVIGEVNRNGSCIIEVPDGWDVQDETLMRTIGKQIGSICKFLEIKREKAAETFNMKAKKYGDDKTNSMIKYINMANDTMLDRLGKLTGDRAEFSISRADEITNTLEAFNNTVIAANDGDENARQTIPEQERYLVGLIARYLYEADKKLGYVEDNFNMADYWNRADFMLGVNSDGTYVLRSLEQLSMAVRNRLSDAAIADEGFNQDNVYNEIRDIIDTVGTDRDPMAVDGDSIIYDCLMSIPVRLQSSLAVSRAITPESSSLDRNYLALNQAARNKFKDMQAQKQKNTSIPKRNAIQLAAAANFNALPKEAKKALRSIASPPSYKNDEGEWISTMDWSERYDYLGRPGEITDEFMIPGPQSLVYFDNHPSTNNTYRNKFLQCRNYGMTAAFTNRKNIPYEWLEDAVEMPNNVWIIPFFDIMVNGSASYPTVATPSEYYINPDRFTVMVMETSNEHSFGDADVKITNYGRQHIHPNFETKPRLFTYDMLFPNAVFKARKGAHFQIEKCTKEEVERLIVNGRLDEDMLQMTSVSGTDGSRINSETIDIDVGVFMDRGDKMFRREVERFKIRLEEYIRNFEKANDESMLESCNYDSIAGFVKIKIMESSMRARYVYAPIIPYHMQDSGRRPVDAKLTNFDIDYDKHAFVGTWRWDGSLDGQYIKFFEGCGGSSKFIAKLDDIEDRRLEDGTYIHGFYSEASVATRFFPQNKRIQSMVNVMNLTRMNSKYAYNFAELPGAFPDPEITLENGKVVNIKDAVLNGDLTNRQWKYIRPLITRFHKDDEIDALIRLWVDRCIEFGTVNPNTLLRTKKGDGSLCPRYTEFECFLDPSMNFQNAWMKLMAQMTTGLIPKNPHKGTQLKNNKDYLFHMVTDDSSSDYGVLQAMVPYRLKDGTYYKIPQHIVISPGFFSGEEFSGYKKVNFNAYRRSIDDLNVAYGKLSDDDARLLLKHARAGMSTAGKIHGAKITATPENIGKDGENDGAV